MPLPADIKAIAEKVNLIDTVIEKSTPNAFCNRLQRRLGNGTGQNKPTDCVVANNLSDFRLFRIVRQRRDSRNRRLNIR